MEMLERYRRIAGVHGLPVMQRGSCNLDARSYKDPDSLWVALRGLNPADGWLEFQSRQLAFRSGLPEPEASWGCLLSAEACTGGGDSLAVNSDGAGGWRLARYQHDADGDGLWDEVVQLAHDLKVGSLRYRRYWSRDSAQGYLQDCACLIGLE